MFLEMHQTSFEMGQTGLHCLHCLMMLTIEMSEPAIFSKAPGGLESKFSEYFKFSNTFIVNVISPTPFALLQPNINPLWVTFVT